MVVATYFLFTDGQRAFLRITNGGAYSEDWRYYTNYATLLGAASGTYYLKSDGVTYRRDFANGYVEVKPGTSPTGTIAITGTLRQARVTLKAAKTSLRGVATKTLPLPPIVLDPTTAVGEAEYKVILRTLNGQTKLAELTGDRDGFLALVYHKQRNDPGLASLVVNAASAAAPYLQQEIQVEIWRRHVAQGLAWTCDFYGFTDVDETVIDATGALTVRIVGQLALLGDFTIGYRAQVANRTVFTSVRAETLLKLLARYNATSAGTVADKRLIAVPNVGISIETDLGRGATLDWTCAWKPLLGELQAIAAVAGGDIDLIKMGAATWEFRFYPGQRGGDRTRDVVFSADRGNIQKLTVTHDRSKERTVAICGGPGQEDARLLTTRTGAGYAASLRRHRETFVNASQAKTVAGLASAGDQSLRDLAARTQVLCVPRQAPGTLYGIHYQVGDLVTVATPTLTAVQIVEAVTISLKAGQPAQYDVQLGQRVRSDGQTALIDEVRSLKAQVAALNAQERA